MGHLGLDLVSIEADNTSLLTCSQEVKAVNMLLKEISEVQKMALVQKDNQGDVFLENNRQLGMCTKHIYIRHQFLRDMDEGNYMDVNYIKSEENPAYIMTKNCPKAEHVKHTNRITEGEIWELVETGRGNIKIDRVTGVEDYDSTKYSSRTLANPVYHTDRSELLLVTRSKNGKKRWTAQ